MNTEDLARNKQNVRRLYEEYINEKKAALLPELVSADYTGPTGEKGPAGFAAVIDSLRAGVPDIRFAVEDLIAEGDRVVLRWTWSGTHTGPLRGLPPSNKAITTSGIAIYQMREGRVVRTWLEHDRLGFLQQIGAVPANFGPPRPPAAAAAH